MDDLLASLQVLGQAIMFSFFLFLFGRLFYALSSMRKLAEKKWQKGFTEFLTALMGIIGIGAIMVLWTGV